MPVLIDRYLGTDQWSVHKCEKVKSAGKLVYSPLWITPDPQNDPCGRIVTFTALGGCTDISKPAKYETSGNPYVCNPKLSCTTVWPAIY